MSNKTEVTVYGLGTLAIATVFNFFLAAIGLVSRRLCSWNSEGVRLDFFGIRQEGDPLMPPHRHHVELRSSRKPVRQFVSDTHDHKPDAPVRKKQARAIQPKRGGDVRER